jgi:hypothetical protein
MPYINMTLEQFEIGFLRDMHPESEVALWFRITKAWLAYHEDFLGNETLPNEEERKLLGALIAISTGIEDLSKLDVPVEVGHRLHHFADFRAAISRLRSAVYFHHGFFGSPSMYRTAAMNVSSRHGS